MAPGAGVSVEERLAALCASFSGQVGMAALSPATGEVIAFGGDRPMSTASVIKLPVLVALMDMCQRGEASLEEPIRLSQADKIGGSGVLQHLTPGLALSLRDVAFLMINLSDNTATNMIIDRVGLARVRAWLEANGYGAIRLQRKITMDTRISDQTPLGLATPEALTRLMAAVYCRQVVSAAACDEMMRMMDSVGLDRVGRELPFTPADFHDETPIQNKLRLAGKTGTMPGLRAQTAAIWRGERGFVITVMTDGSTEPEVGRPDAEGIVLIGRLGRAVYDHFLG
jgi:beta-lactamase class A